MLKKYQDIYWFLNYLNEVWQHKDKIPNRYYEDATSKSRFEYFSEKMDAQF